MDKPMQIPENMSGLQPSEKAMGPQTTADQMTWLSGDGEASPEEQEVYEALVAGAIEAMSAEGVDESIASQIAEAQDLPETMGFVSGTLFERAMAAAEDAGMTVPDEVIFPAVLEIYSNVVEMAEDTGKAPDQDAINNGFYHALDKVRLAMQKMGRITPEQAAAELEELKALEASGELAGMAPQGGGQLAQPAPQPAQQTAQKPRQGFAAMGAA